MHFEPNVKNNIIVESRKIFLKQLKDCGFESRLSDLPVEFFPTELRKVLSISPPPSA